MTRVHVGKLGLCLTAITIRLGALEPRAYTKRLVHDHLGILMQPRMDYKSPCTDSYIGTEYIPDHPVSEETN